MQTDERQSPIHLQLHANTSKYQVVKINMFAVKCENINCQLIALSVSASE